MMVMMLLVSIHVVTLKANPGVDSFHLRAIVLILLTSFWVREKTSEFVEVLPMESTFLFFLFLLLLFHKIVLKSLLSSLIECILILSIQDFSIVLCFFLESKFILVLIFWDNHVVTRHYPGVWGIHHCPVWE